MNPTPRVALVVTTIGRPETLDRLLRSVLEQSLPATEMIVVDQSGGTGTAEVVERWRERLPVRRVTTPRGLSAGRNAGVAALGDYDIVGFPDDDTWYAPDTLARVCEAIGGHGVVSGMLLDAAGQPTQLAFGAEPAVLDGATVWSQAIEATCFYTAAFMGAVGSFDEGLGAGCSTPWQSGEGTDLLLRGLRDGWSIAYHPRVIVYEDNPFVPAAGTREFRRRARHVARGTGRVYRRHHGWGARFRVLARPLGGALLSVARARWADAGWHLQRLIGRLEGITGILLPVRRHVHSRT
ncbi:glycosyltransferase family 2 protein [Streptosporangium amethystogenes]|uniref:glycosyltransferase family 2 protein n=1 Tax=Streptosporangium amethystogenes TaxID=2002 RepID=UPI00378AAF5B